MHAYMKKPQKCLYQGEGKFYQKNKSFYHTFLGTGGEKSANAAQ